MRTYQQREHARAVFYGDLSEEEQARRGEAIARALRLKREKEHPDRYLTEWGTKTALGLFRTVQAQLEGIL